MLGTFINTAAILLGAVIGLLLKKGINEKISETIMIGLGLCTLYIGISGILKGEHILIMILSVAIGSVIGELFDFDKRIKQLGGKLEALFIKDKNSETSIANGFVSASLLFCVGAMAIVGSLQSGLSGNHETLITKSLIDGIAAAVLSASLGAGVIFSAGAVLLYQGSITLLAQYISPFLSSAVINEMTCVGSLLIIGLALNMIRATEIKIMNYIPAIFLPILFFLVL